MITTLGRRTLTQTELEFGLRRQFRYYTRCVCQAPMSVYYHTKRLQVAAKIGQTEPYQGALADYFFACWYDMATEGRLILEEAAGRLPKHVVSAFGEFVNQGEHLPAISPLATRFSVLVSPSMNVPQHRVYMDKDESKKIAKSLQEALLVAKQNGDDGLIEQIEQDYLAHCLACQDRMGFMMTWFALSRAGWEFDEKWHACKASLEAMS